MKIIIILITLIILYFILKNNIIENMALINTSNKCCVIKKIPDNNNFKYCFSVSNNCDGMYDNNTRTIKEGDIVDGKPFILNDCNEEAFQKTVGSCRKMGFECVDFITPSDCNQYKLKWDENTCNMLPKAYN